MKDVDKGNYQHIEYALTSIHLLHAPLQLL